MLKGAQKSAKQLANTNPVSAAMYAELEKRVRNKLRRQRKKSAKRNKNIVRDDGNRHFVEAPAVMAVAAGGVTPMILTDGETKLMDGQELIFPYLQPTNNTWYFDSDGILINPLEAIFPLLANEAVNYQMYRFTKLNMQYENTCSTSTPGQLYLGCLTDPSDSVPTGPEEATAIKHSVRGPVWSSMSFDFPCDGMFRYINGTSISDADLRNVYQFRAWFGILNGALNIPIGSVRISYEIELCKRVAGQDLNLIDIAIPAGTSPINIVTAIATATAKDRGPRWYKFDGIEIFFQAYGTYTLQTFIQSSANIDVYTAVQNLADSLVDGRTNTQYPTAEIIFQAGSYRTLTDTNTSCGTISMRFSVKRGDYLDFSGLSSLSSGTLSGLFSMERE